MKARKWWAWFLVSITVFMPITAQSKDLEWQEVSDPTFGGSFYFFVCRGEHKSRIDHDGVVSPLSFFTGKEGLLHFKLDVRRKTIKFHKFGTRLPVKVKAEMLKESYFKTVVAFWSSKNGGDGKKSFVKIAIYADPSRPSEFRSSFSYPDGTVRNIEFGTCVSP